ncbi:hypothetical protein [Spirosoma endbachense]|uniref:Uncharacterized protein n=1 Tax=Spirosoma endbachense TaxID=2666025 RepID=A0A6P1VRB6_9BACT|nr:hypothetical protein [Spirosoma endbachense]QHV95235.1 hypothetical protein GJR95_09520 [Spirosoma endbachense]
MRTNLIRKVTGCVAITVLVTSPLVTSFAGSAPSQGGLIASAKATTETAPFRDKAESEKMTKAPVLIRKAPTKTETTPTTTATTNPKEQKTHDKKTISRCWKRLMTMVREVSHAHQTKK